MGGIRKSLGTDYWLCSGRHLFVMKVSILQHVHGVTERIGHILVETVCHELDFFSRLLIPKSKVSP